MTSFYAAVTDLPVPEAADSAAVAPLPRLPALERLLARGERQPATPDWRRWALATAGLAAPPGDLPLGRLLAVAHGLHSTAPDDTWLAATPVHLVAGLTRVQLDPAGPVALGATAAAELAARFAAEWGGETCALHATGPHLVLRHRGALELATVDPELLAGRDIAAALPSGRDAGPITRLMTELQMWLHARPPAATRRPVNGLWLWGAGRGALNGAPRWPVLECADPYLGAALHCHPGTADRSARIVRWHALDVLGRGEPFVSVDAAWFAPLGRALATGELDRAELHLGAITCRLWPRQRFRVWVRPRPWWEIAA
ncbi:MAG TPA: hypothetical protein VN790_05435 [Steroidobacteraceae bacterium]|nr:hypothetical protein [Steroidobacteraceae bacterium]